MHDSKGFALIFSVSVMFAFVATPLCLIFLVFGHNLLDLDDRKPLNTFKVFFKDKGDTHSMHLI